MDALTSGVVEWGAAERPFDPLGESGDRYLVQPYADGALVAVADGLGHGPDAATAAKTAMAILESGRAPSRSPRSSSAATSTCGQRAAPH